jgi:Zn-dependent membrane protease YugP
MIEYYIISIAAMLFCAMIAGIASARVHSAYKKYGKMPTQSHYTGYDTAVRLLRVNGVRDIAVGRVGGELSDHYHPTKKQVNLSSGVYGSDSIAACAVAAHEIGHVLQKKRGYIPYKIRTALVPVVNIGSRLALPLVIVGMLLDLFVYYEGESTLGFTLAMVGVALYGSAFLFQLVTLPVEYNASRRAKIMLREEGILTDRELIGADKVLDAAALTYVAGMATSLIYFLRFLIWVLAIFGRRRD